MIIATHMHYTIDIIGAVVASAGVFAAYHAIVAAKREQLGKMPVLKLFVPAIKWFDAEFRESQDSYNDLV